MTPSLVFAIVAVFAGVAVGTGVITWSLVSRRDPERKRLRELARPRTQPSHCQRHSLRILQLQPCGGSRGGCRHRRKASGGFGLGSPRLGAAAAAPSVIFSAAQFLVAGIGAVALLVVLGTAGWQWAAIGAAAGFLVPNLVLHHKFKQRQKAIQNGLPDALDLCIVCLEAGCSLDHAIGKTSEELALVHPALAEELTLIRAETQAGQSKLAAFKHFGARTQLEDVRSLVALLVQTDRYGTSVAQALRTYAETSRSKRRQRAEERAAKAGVKLVFPLVCFLFPAFYLIILGPALVQFARVFREIASNF